MIIDSSNSVVDVDYTSLMSNLAAGVENTLDEEDRLGFLFAFTFYSKIQSFFKMYIV